MCEWSLTGISTGVGKGVLEKIPSMGEVWIFSGTTQCKSGVDGSWFWFNKVNVTSLLKKKT